MDRNKLKALLKFVKEISNVPGNEWFKDQLIGFLQSNGVKKEPVDVDFSTGNSENLDQKVNLIRNYLTLDLQNLIDYSWFEEPSREQLFRDCIEMSRFEKGTPNHKKNFGEFCRYGHLQAEEMVNYFFLKIFNKDVRSVNRYLKQKNSNYSPTQEPTSIIHIPYKIKLTALKDVVTLDKKTSSHLYFLNDFRNELSHRSSLSEVNDDKTLQEFEMNGFLDGGYIDFNQLSKDQSKLYNEGRFIINKRKEEFFLVYEVLEDLKSKISQAITNGVNLLTNYKS